MISAAFLILASQAATIEPEANRLDLFMQDVTEACLLPDLKKSDPKAYLTSHGWTSLGRTGQLGKRINDTQYSVTVKWPANKKFSASCSFETEQVTSFDVYDWFRKRIGEPQDIRWDATQVGGWRINTNGHGVGVYVSRKNSKSSDRAGMMLHILQH